jgi:urocanate hydratase
MTHPGTPEPDSVKLSGGSEGRIRAPRRPALTCRGWHQEAALRMLTNSLDEEVVEPPEGLLVCRGTPSPVRNRDAYNVAVRLLKNLQGSETLLIQSGEPAGVIATDAAAPRVLIVDSDLAGAPSGGGPLAEAERLGPALFGQDARRSWTYTGSQQALSTAFETFTAVGKAHFGGDLGGRLIVSGGMGGAGGVLPLAAALAGAAFLGIEADGEKIKRRIRAGYCDFCVYSLDEALRILKNAVRQKQPVSVGIEGNCAEIIPELAKRGVVPDILTDLTGACDLLNGYVPAGLTLEQAEALRRTHPNDYYQRAGDSLGRHAQGMVELEKLGALNFDLGNNLLRVARERGGVREATAPPGFVSAYLRPAFAEGRAPSRWVALSGEAGDIHRVDDLLLQLFPDDVMLARWIRLARKHVKFQGLPARVAWLGPEQRVRFAERLNALAANGGLKAPVAIARDRISCGPELSRLMESRKGEGGSDRAKGRTVLAAVLNLDSGASWISVQSEGTDETAPTCHTTQAAVADGTPRAGKRLQRIVEQDCYFGLLRQASAR